MGRNHKTRKPNKGCNSNQVKKSNIPAVIEETASGEDEDKQIVGLVFVDRVLDPVHGFIDLTRVEQRIVNLPVFKRLQSIKQLSMTNWVFPGAEHTRYMHSLGVMHIADQMAINLKKPDNSLLFSEKDRQVLRLAGLLHDIGHYPLSHVTESAFLDTLYNSEDIIEKHCDDTIKKIDKIKASSIPEYMKSRRSKALHHETMGTKVIEFSEDIQEIIRTECSYINIKDICDIIVGCIDLDIGNRGNKEGVEFGKLSAMVQLIHSEVDADGIDYIMRDASFSGTTYGGFELGILLRSLRVVEKDGIQIVGIRPKGISVIDQYLMSKYFSYTQVIFNRHVMVLDQMAEMLTHAFIKMRTEYPDNATIEGGYLKRVSSTDEFLRFTDRFFWKTLDSVDKKRMKYTIKENIITIFDRFSCYQELPMKDEIIITSNEPEKVYERIISSNIYADLQQKKENKLVIFEMRGFTNEIKEKEYIGFCDELKPNESTKKKHMLERLLEGVPIIEDRDEGYKISGLLVDDSRSIMYRMYDTKTYILREYSIE